MFFWHFIPLALEYAWKIKGWKLKATLYIILLLHHPFWMLNVIFQIESGES